MLASMLICLTSVSRRRIDTHAHTHRVTHKNTYKHSHEATATAMDDAVAVNIQINDKQADEWVKMLNPLAGFCRQDTITQDGDNPTQLK